MTKYVFLERRDSWGEIDYRMSRRWEVQRKPYVSSLPFQFECNLRTSVQSSDGSPYSPSYGQWIISRRGMQSTINRSYDKLVNQVGDSSTWANNMLEYTGTTDMIVGRVSQLTRFANALRKGDFSKAAKSLKLDNPPKGYRGKKNRSPKDFGDAFLEWHFGWEPLINDIGQSVETLQKTDFGLRQIRSSVLEQYQENHRFESGDSYIRDEQQGTLQVKMGISARISNPNAFLANRMGFVNPLSVAWEAVPFSFVVDWFANVGQCLSSFSDFVGVEITDSFTTTFQRGNRYWKNVTGSSPGFPSVTYTFGSFGVICERQPFVSGPSLEVKPFKGLSLTRAATAISLLVKAL